MKRDSSLRRSVMVAFAGILLLVLIAIMVVSGRLKFNHSSSRVVVFGTHALDESQVVRLTMRSRLSEKKFAILVKNKEDDLRSVLNTLSLTDLSDEARIRIAYRSVRKALGPQSGIISIKIDSAIDPESRTPDQELLELLEGSPGNIGYVTEN